MKSWIGLRITAEIDGNGPALLRRLLPEIAGAIERGEFGKTVPDRLVLGDVLVELGAGPAPRELPGDAEVAPRKPRAPEPAQGAAVEVEFPHG